MSTRDFAMSLVLWTILIVLLSSAPRGLAATLPSNSPISPSVQPDGMSAYAQSYATTPDFGSDMERSPEVSLTEEPTEFIEPNLDNSPFSASAVTTNPAIVAAITPPVEATTFPSRNPPPTHHSSTTNVVSTSQFSEPPAANQDTPTDTIPPLTSSSPQQQSHPQPAWTESPEQSFAAPTDISPESTHSPSPAMQPKATTDPSNHAEPSSTFFQETYDSQPSPSVPPEVDLRDPNDAHNTESEESVEESPEVMIQPVDTPHVSEAPEVATSTIRFSVTASNVPSSIPPNRVAGSIADIATEAIGVDIQVGGVKVRDQSSSRILSLFLPRSARYDASDNSGPTRTIDVELLADVPKGSSRRVRKQMVDWVKSGSWRKQLEGSHMSNVQLVVADTSPPDRDNAPATGGTTGGINRKRPEQNDKSPGKGKDTKRKHESEASGMSLGGALGIATAAIVVLAVISLFAVWTVRARRHRDEPIEIRTVRTEALTQDDDCTGMEASESNYSVPSMRYSFARESNYLENNVDTEFAHYVDARPSDATSILTSSTAGVLRDSEDVSAFGDDVASNHYSVEYDGARSLYESDVDPLPTKPRFADRLRNDY